jgi:hypothetical protein
MANLYYFKYTTLDPFNERKTVQYGGIIAADSWGEAADIIEAQETAKDGVCDLICIDQLECSEKIIFTDNLELYNKVYEEMM